MNNLPLAVTTGDFDGIGAEVIKKALKFLNIPKYKIIIVGRNLGLDYKTIEVPGEEVGEVSYNAIKTACELAKNGEIRGIVTAPVSKEELNNAGHHFSGQTEILEKLLAHDNQRAEMLFSAKDLKVLLFTRHLPLKNIKIDEKTFLEKTRRLNKIIPGGRFALCALNPHSGEEGLLGSEEKEILIPAVKKLRLEGINITMPLPADALFAKVGTRYLNSEKQEYDCIIAMYHDQGLVPLKALASEIAVNVTIGLDILRTSPSHGTAKDIFEKNIADPKSMIEAFRFFETNFARNYKLK